MTKLIAVFIILLCIMGGLGIYSFWDRIANEKEEARQSKNLDVRSDELGGLPRDYEYSLQVAHDRGAAGLRDWLKAYGKVAQDPRKAWIELDYVVAVARDNPGEARKVFAEVKGRTPTNSPVMKRIRLLEKTYE